MIAFEILEQVIPVKLYSPLGLVLLFIFEEGKRVYNY